MIDIAMCLDRLTPGAAYGGSLTEDYINHEHGGGNPQAAYKALRWEDARPQPSWVEIEAVWPEVQIEIAESLLKQEATPRDLEAEVTDLQTRLKKLETTRSPLPGR